MATNQSSQAHVTRGRRRPKWPFVVAGIVIFIMLAVLLTPVYLSSDGFRRMVQTRIDRSTGGTTAIGDLTIGWFRGVRISDFSFRDKAGWAHVNIAGIDAQPQLGALLGGTLALGETVIDKPRIEIDMRKQPVAATAQTSSESASSSAKTASLGILGNLAINDGNVQLTDRQGKTVEFANVDSQIHLRAPGQSSHVELAMVVADAGHEAKIRAAGNVTPAKSTGWTLKGTSGDVVVEVNDLKLDSLAAVFELAGVELQTKGQISAEVKGTLKDGQMATATATITGEDLDITGEAISGDRIQTSRLDVTAKLAQTGQTLQIDQLQAQTDWASLTATGTMPTSSKSVADLLKTESTYDLQGTFDCNLSALLSQMAHTFGLKEGMQITAGRVTGTATSTTQDGRAMFAVQTKIVGVAGNVDGKELSISEPVVADLRLSADEQTTQLDTLELSASFAKINASGSFEQIAYDGRIDLTTLQAELGEFADLGPYQMGGIVTSQGQIAIQDSNVVATGAVTTTNLALASADGNSVSEPEAAVDFAIRMDRSQQLLVVDRAEIKAGFGRLNTKDATVPVGQTSSQPLKADVTAQDLDLAKLKPYAVLFASFPKEMDLAGVTQSHIALTGQKGTYRLQTTDTEIQDFKLVAPGKEPFEQKQVALQFDVQVDPNAKSINVETFTLESPQIKITKGQFAKKQTNKTAHIQGNLEGECDWAAVERIAPQFLPEGLGLTGKRPVALNFASTYPADDPNMLMAGLDATTSTGFDSALYKGLNIGSTDLDIRIEDGLMTIAPFTTTMNNGQISFAAQANFKERARLLHTPEPMMLAKSIELNKEMTGQLLQYVNPLFANVTGISGVASFECEKLAIPLAAGMEKETVVVGTLSADNILLEASGLLETILNVTGQSLHGQRLTVRPTRITLQNGRLQYDNMQIDVGDNPITFGGTIGLDGQLDMIITLPWTFRGRTVRIGREDQAGPRIEVPLKGTIGRPELNTDRLLQDQLFKGLESLF